VKKNFVIWARVSSREQAREGHSLTGQVADLSKYAQQVGGKVHKVFQVTETASVKSERRCFRDLMAYVRANRKDLTGILVMSIDRATRNLEDWVELQKLEIETGVRLISITQPTEDTPSGHFSRNLFAVVASNFSEQLKHNIRLGQQRRVEAGQCLGKAAYGLLNVRRDGRSIIEEHFQHAEIVRRIFCLFSSGLHSVKSLTAELKRLGLTYTARSPDFNKTKVYAMLKDRTYVGEVFWKGEWHPGRFPRIIDQITFNRVQQILDGPERRSHELVYAGGLIRCGHCRHSYTGEEVFKNRGLPKEKRYRYYRCSEHSTTPGHQKDWRFSESELDQQVLALFGKLHIADAEYREWFIEVIRTRAGKDQDTAKKHLAELKRQHSRMSAERDRLVEVHLTADINRETYMKKAANYRDSLAQLTEQMAAIDTTAADNGDLAVKVVELSQSLSQRWLSSDFAAKRSILDMVGSNYRFEGVKLCVTMNKPFDVIAEGLIQEKLEAPGIEPGSGFVRTTRLRV